MITQAPKMHFLMIFDNFVITNFSSQNKNTKKASPIVFHLFRVAFGLLQVVLRCSGLFQPVLACYGTFQVVLFLQTTTSQNALIMKFIKKYKVAQASSQSGAVLLYYKKEQVLLQSEAAFLYYKAGQVALKSRAGITKWVGITK